MQTDEARRIIEAYGGQAQFARLSGIKEKTIREVYSGRNGVSSAMAVAIRKTVELEDIKVKHEALVQALRVVNGV